MVHRETLTLGQGGGASKLVRPVGDFNGGSRWKGLLFPMHNYLGPGNPINNGPPVDTDDMIAEKHDIAYHMARGSGDIRRADVEAIKEFMADAVANNNWHAAVGAVGIGVKYLVESGTGVIYPRRVSNLRWDMRRGEKKEDRIPLLKGRGYHRLGEEDGEEESVMERREKVIRPHVNELTGKEYVVYESVTCKGNCTSGCERKMGGQNVGKAWYGAMEGLLGNRREVIFSNPEKKKSYVGWNDDGVRPWGSIDRMTSPVVLFSFQKKERRQWHWTQFKQEEEEEEEIERQEDPSPFSRGDLTRRPMRLRGGGSPVREEKGSGSESENEKEEKESRQEVNENAEVKELEGSPMEYQGQGEGMLSTPQSTTIRRLPTQPPAKRKKNLIESSPESQAEEEEAKEEQVVFTGDAFETAQQELNEYLRINFSKNRHDKKFQSWLGVMRMEYDLARRQLDKAWKMSGTVEGMDRKMEDLINTVEDWKEKEVKDIEKAVEKKAEEMFAKMRRALDVQTQTAMEEATVREKERVSEWERAIGRVTEMEKHLEARCKQVDAYVKNMKELNENINRVTKDIDALGLKSIVQDIRTAEKQISIAMQKRTKADEEERVREIQKAQKVQEDRRTQEERVRKSRRVQEEKRTQECRKEPEKQAKKEMTVEEVGKRQGAIPKTYASAIRRVSDSEESIDNRRNEVEPRPQRERRSERGGREKSVSFLTLPRGVGDKDSGNGEKKGEDKIEKMETDEIQPGGAAGFMPAGEESEDEGNGYVGKMSKGQRRKLNMHRRMMNMAASRNAEEGRAESREGTTEETEEETFQTVVARRRKQQGRGRRNEPIVSRRNFQASPGGPVVWVVPPQGTEDPEKVVKEVLGSDTEIRIRGMVRIGPKVKVVLDSEGEIEKIKGVEKFGTKGISVREENWLRPRVIIKGVDSGITGEELPAALVKKNPPLKEMIGEERMDDQMIVVRNFRGGERTNSWVLEVAPKIYKWLMEQGKVFVKFNRCAVTKYNRVIRCLKCQGIGHTGTRCEHDVVCEHCSVVGHHMNKCPNLRRAPVCVNCAERRIAARYHRASANTCPVMEMARSKVEKRIRYD